MRHEELDAGFDLLDRQLLDCHGDPTGKVDDLELTPIDDGPPVVTAILTGSMALAPRIGGRLGYWVYALNRWLRPGYQTGPIRIPMSSVRTIDSAVHLTADRNDLGTQRVEDWLRANVIEPIPGADHAHG